MISFEGKIQPPKDGEEYWSVEIPDLGVFTQGEDEKDAYLMAKDAVECLIDREDFEVTIAPGKGNKFWVSANNPAPLFAIWLKKLRAEKGITVRELAKRLGSKQSRAWLQYESGDISPTVTKLSQLLEAIEPGKPFFLKQAQV